MTNARFAYENWFSTGTITTTSESAALPAQNLRNQEGDPSRGWQTADGVRAASVYLTMPSAVAWRDFALARTNYTPDVAVRIAVDDYLELLADPTVLPTDTDAGASRGANMTRIGSTTMADGTPGTVYESSSTTNSSVGASFALKPGRYRVSVKAQRISGSGTTGRLIGARYWQGGQLRTVNVLMTALAASGVATYSAEITNDAAATVTMVFLGETGPVGQVAIGAGLITPLPRYDSGTLTGLVRGYRQLVHVAPAEQTGLCARISISDPTNPDGNLNTPLAFAGVGWEPALNISPASAYSATRRTTERETRAGGLVIRPEFYRRGYVLAHDGTTEADQWLRLEEMARLAWAGQNVLAIPDPDSPFMQREAVLGRLQVESDVTFPYGAADLRAWRARIDERL